MDKLCSTCKQEKPTSDFPKKTTSPDGLLARCRSCHKAAIAAYRAVPENRERLRAAQRRWAAAHSAKKQEYYRNWTAKNAEREKARGRARYHAQKDRFRDRYLRRSHRISLSQYRAILDAQGGRCAICGTMAQQSLHVDHCHHSNTIRGLLCGPCNRGLGYLGDSPTRLLAAVAYLANHQSLKLA